MAEKNNLPFAVHVEEGKSYSWCTCGYTQTQPFCDGSHRQYSDKKSLKWTSPTTGTVYLCGCKQTKNAPFCDSSHTSLPSES